MSGPTLRSGSPLWILRGPDAAGARDGVTLRPVGDGDPVALVLDWGTTRPPDANGGTVLEVVVREVRNTAAPADPNGELAIEGGVVLLTLMRVGPVSAEQVLTDLERATHHLLRRFDDVVRGVAYAVSPDRNQLVEVLAATGARAMHDIQSDPEVSGHAAHVGDSLASMEPALYRPERIGRPTTA